MARSAIAGNDGRDFAIERDRRHRSGPLCVRCKSRRSQEQNQTGSTAHRTFHAATGKSHVNSGVTEATAELQNYKSRLFAHDAPGQNEICLTTAPHFTKPSQNKICPFSQLEY